MDESIACQGTPVNLPSSSGTRRRLLAVLVVAATATGAGWPAISKADTAPPYDAETITFQEGLVADNAPITTQYAAGYGVEFGTAAALGYPGASLQGVDDKQPVLLTDGYTAPSTNNVEKLEARSAGCGPLGGEFPPPPDFMVHLDDARASLSLELQVFAPGSSINGGAQIVAYGQDGTQLDEVTVSEASAGSWQRVDLASTDPGGIRYVRVASQGSRDGVQIDDLQLPAALPSGIPSWHLTTTQTTVDLVEGDSVKVPVDVIRQNGSTGTITVAADDGSNPALAQLSVDQSPTGVPPGTVDVLMTAQPGEVGKTAAVTLSGTPAGVAAGTSDQPAPVITVHVLQDLGLLVTGPPSAGAGCAVPVQEVLHAAGTTAMTVAITGSDGLSGTVEVTGPGDYSLPGTAVVDPGRAAIKGPEPADSATFEAKPSGGAGFAPATATLSIRTAVPRVTGVSGEYVTPEQLPVFKASSLYKNTVLPDTLSISASGLPCHVLKLSVGSDHALTTSFRPGYATSATTFTVAVPGDAVSGPVKVIDTTADPNPTVAVLPAIDVVDLRHDDGMPFPNNLNVNNLTWSDFANTFGVDHVTDCTPVGCWEDSGSVAWFNYITSLEPIGLCFGFMMLTSEFFTGSASPADFGVKEAAELHAPVSAGVVNRSPLGQELVDEWMSQFDLDYQTATQGQFAKAISVPAFASSLALALRRDGIAFIDLQNPKPGPGHSVIAYGISQTSATSWTIDTDNPNVPFTPAEAAADKLHRANVTASQIVLNSASVAKAWAMSGDLGWSGPMSKIAFTTLAQRPLAPSLGTSWADVLGSSPSSGGADASVMQISTGGRDLLAPGGAPLDRGDVRLFEPSDAPTKDPMAGIYSLAPGRSYRIDVVARRAGGDSIMVVSRQGAEGVEAATAGPGATQQLSLTPGDSTVSYSGTSTSSVQLEVSDGHAATSRSLIVTLGSGAGVTTVGLDGADASVRHSGPATSVGFEWLSAARAAGTSTFSLAGGEQASLTPPWGATSSKLGVEVRGAGPARRLVLSVSSSRATTFHRLVVPRPTHRHEKELRRA